MIFCQYCRDCLYEKAIDIYSRRGAGYAKKFTGIRQNDFSRERRLFATKVAPTQIIETPAFSAPLRENRMSNPQLRPVFR